MLHKTFIDANKRFLIKGKRSNWYIKAKRTFRKPFVFTSYFSLRGVHQQLFYYTYYKTCHRFSFSIRKHHIHQDYFPLFPLIPVHMGGRYLFRKLTSALIKCLVADYRKESKGWRRCSLVVANSTYLAPNGYTPILLGLLQTQDFPCVKLLR